MKLQWLRSLVAGTFGSFLHEPTALSFVSICSLLTSDVNAEIANGDEQVKACGIWICNYTDG